MSVYASLVSVYDRLFPLPTAALPFLEGLVPAAPGRARRVLDAGCATGSLLLALAERGWEAVGIEPEAGMIAAGRSEARRRGLGSARFVEGDMLEAERIAGPGPFDLVLCLGNTLPHLSREGARRFLGLGRSLLAPGGALVLQLLNYAKPGVGPGFAFPELSAGRLRFRRRYEAGAAGALSFVTELSEEGGESSRHDLPLEPLEPDWLLGALREAGFAPPALSPGWGGGDFEADRDLYLLLVARLPD